VSPTDFFSDKEHQPWTLAQIYADLGSASDVAEVLNVTPRRITGWTKARDNNGCPHAIRQFGPTMVYSIREWQDWYVRYLDRYPYLENYGDENQRLLNEARRFFGE
jgi:hypothetical protein